MHLCCTWYDMCIYVDDGTGLPQPTRFGTHFWNCIDNLYFFLPRWATTPPSEAARGGTGKVDRLRPCRRRVGGRNSSSVDRSDTVLSKKRLGLNFKLALAFGRVTERLLVLTCFACRGYKANRQLVVVRSSATCSATGSRGRIKGAVVYMTVSDIACLQTEYCCKA